MTEVRIKHAQFMYHVPVEDVNPNTNEPRTRLVRRIALRGETIDIPREEDIKRGRDADAFETAEEREEAVTGGPDETEVEAPGDEEFDDHDALVRWIRDEKPNARTVVAAADDDPDKAQALIEAENEASGGDPRRTVVEPLTRITEREQ